MTKISLTDLLLLNNMKYSDEVKPKHQKKMDLQLELVGEVVIPLKPFSENLCDKFSKKS